MTTNIIEKAGDGQKETVKKAMTKLGMDEQASGRLYYIALPRGDLKPV